MNILLMVIIAISVSIDALGIGISYGLRNINIKGFSRVIIFLITYIATFVAMYIGSTLSLFLSPNIAILLSTVMLIGLGIFIIVQALKGENKKKKGKIKRKRKKKIKFREYNFNNLGLTIKIIRNPISGDIDKSNSIDAFEAIFLSLAMSIDSFGAGIISGIGDMNIFLVPLFVACFQILFLCSGNILSKKLINSKKFSSKFFEVLSGVVLIILSIVKYFY